MRIVSMLPSATEIAYALGLGEHVVGVSHECDYPPDARTKPSITRAPFDHHALPSAEIDRIVSETVAVGRELYHVDAERMRELQPDLVLTQGLCEVCAVSVKAVNDALSAGPRVLSLDAGGLDGVLADVERVAEAAGVAEKGREVPSGLRARLDGVRTRAETLPRKRVACLEWLDPPYNAGHWVPEMVDLAGGTEVLSRRGEYSCRIEWREVVEAQPDVLVLMPCGFGPERSLGELSILQEKPGWDGIPAVRSGEVWAVDANSYFSRPGPRLVDGVEALAGILHPETFSRPDATVAVRAALAHGSTARA